jgi:hypothetical protein
LGLGKRTHSLSREYQVLIIDFHPKWNTWKKNLKNKITGKSKHTGEEEF